MLDFTVTSAITVINLLILFFVLKKVLFKPLTKFIAARQAKVQGELDAAARERSEAKSLRETYEAKIENAEREAAAIVKKASEQGAARADRLVAEGAAQAELIITAAKKQVASERQAAYLLFKAEASRLVIAAAGKLLGREISGADVRALAEEAINECAATRSVYKN
jgi:F-type H+-transporting ATPase subunit b